MRSFRFLFLFFTLTTDESLILLVSIRTVSRCPRVQHQQKKKETTKERQQNRGEQWLHQAEDSGILPFLGLLKVFFPIPSDVFHPVTGSILACRLDKTIKQAVQQITAEHWGSRGNSHHGIKAHRSLVGCPENGSWQWVSSTRYDTYTLIPHWGFVTRDKISLNIRVCRGLIRIIHIYARSWGRGLKVCVINWLKLGWQLP